MRFHRRTASLINDVAKQRLQIMTDSEPAECSPELMVRMKKEISDVAARYFPFPLEEYEIKVILRHKKERAQDV